jgi:hypothetical protein
MITLKIAPKDLKNQSSGRAAENQSSGRGLKTPEVLSVHTLRSIVSVTCVFGRRESQEREQSRKRG